VPCAGIRIKNIHNVRHTRGIIDICIQNASNVKNKTCLHTHKRPSHITAYSTQSLPHQRTGTTRKQSQSLRWQRRCTEIRAFDAQLSGVPCAGIRIKNIHNVKMSSGSCIRKVSNLPKWHQYTNKRPSRISTYSTQSLSHQRTVTTREQSQSLRWQRRCTENRACDTQLSGVPCASARLYEIGSRSRGVLIPLLQLLALDLVALERSVRRQCSCSAHHVQEHARQHEQRKRRDASHKGMQNAIPHCV
jgi:hypothetical protein